MTSTARPVFGFDVTGLPGYRVEESRAAPGKYNVVVSAGTVISFGWNDETGRHDVPHVAEYDGYAVESRNTCKGAVAAAHAHAEHVRTWVARGCTHDGKAA